MTKKHRTGYMFRKGNRFYLQYDIEGKRFIKSLKTDDEGEAQKKRTAIMRPYVAASEVEALGATLARLDAAKAEAGSLIPALKITEAWAAYEAAGNRPDSGARTLEGYASQFARFQKWVAEHHATVTELRHVDAKTANEYAASLKADKYSPSTYNQHIKTLDLVWAVLREPGKIDVNPWAWDKKGKTGMKRLTINKIERRKKAVSLEQIGTLLEKAAGDYKDLLTMLAYTGQRLVDMVKLQWDAVDFRSRVITLSPRKTERRTGKEVFIPLLPAAESVLLNRTREGRYVFPALVTEYERDNGTSMAKKIGAIFTAATLNRHKKNSKGGRAIVEYGAHSLRHGFVTIARGAGIPDAVIRQITGHSTAEMVDHYSQFDKALAGALASKALQAPAVQEDAEPLKALPGPRMIDAEKVCELAEKLTAKNAAKIRIQLLAMAM